MEYPWRRRKLQRTKSLARKMLQLLGMERIYVRSVGDDEEELTRIDVSLDYNYSKENEAAFLEVERKKAMALMEMQRQRLRFL